MHHRSLSHGKSQHPLPPSQLLSITFESAPLQQGISYADHRSQMTEKTNEKVSPRRTCELCKGEAALFCPSDSAFLCSACDALVHAANFLAARHLRHPICPSCHSITDDLSPCASCTADSSSSTATSSAASSTSCISSAAVISRPRSRPRRSEDIGAMADEVLESWCRRTGVNAASAAAQAMRIGARRLPALPVRILAAAAVLFAARLCGGGERKRAVWGFLLKKVEACSGVPAKVIAAAEARLGRAIRSEHVHEEEGSAECN